MTTVIPFIPSNITPPEFFLMLDNGNYVCKITWNISSQRYYINIYGVDGTWVVTIPLIQTPPARAVNTIIYDPLQQLAIVQMIPTEDWPTPTPPGGSVILPGTIVDYTLEGFDPPNYNGLFRCLQINGTTFSFPMTSDPGPLVVAGNVNRLLNMVAGVFSTSTMIYRNGSFEINP